MRPVFITGLGILSAAGAGRSAFTRAWVESRLPPEAVSPDDSSERGRLVRVARLAPFDPREYVPAGRVRRMSPGSVPPVVAAVLSERDAQEAGAENSTPPERRALILGTGLGPLGITGEILDLLARDGPAGAEPFLFIESLHNSPAGHASILLECKGPTLTPVAGDASALVAVALGVRMIQEGRAERVYAGGSEEISSFFQSLLRRIVPPRRAIPLLGEGAAVFRLDANPVGARPYARAVASAMAHDPSGSGLGYGADPEIPRRVLERTLRKAGWDPEEVDLLVTAGNGFSDLDSLERRVYAGWPAPLRAGRCRRESPARTFGALAGSGGLAVAAAALELKSGRTKRALICLPAWGGSCQALALSAPAA